MAYNGESDRRSAVSSFYGGRKSPFDTLANERVASPAGTTAQRGVRDDASSFFGHAPRESADLLTGNAGYNKNSFFDAGREAPVKGVQDEEEMLGGPPGGAGWDVFADFNNAGPRYSSAFGQQTPGYQQLPPETTPMMTPSSKHEMESSAGGNVEMITVPALGAEWKRSELEGMRKSSKNKDRGAERWRAFRQWTRDQRGCFGSKWGTRKQIAIGLFIFCCIAAITLAFTIPRVPAFSFNGQSPLTNSSLPPAPHFSRAPANFSFNANIDLRIDSTSNYIPIKFSDLSAQVFDLDTARLVGTGDLKGRSLKQRTFTEVFFPLNFTYVANNDTDPTWGNWYNACKSKSQYADGKRPGVDFRIVFTMKIGGLIGTRQAGTSISNVNCPFELPSNSA
ncbi:hypothetical protein BD410DRAFT_830185 [Rickenella mellea]|uniref:Uncharacterized protein n=1 Tax=Rickenella mellea TaxID=50990 RepID=A0A4Y7PXI1_9AGAM|nr:hypothetical protein BD410DRAFT_830185 [Rickenella mellea]